MPDIDIDRSACTAAKHGTSRAYKAYGCRCPDAKTAARRPQTAGTGQQRRGPAGNTQLDPTDLAIAWERVHTGGPPPLIGVPERRALVAMLTDQHWSARRIATALGLAQRNVVRHRGALRKEAA